MGWKQRLGQKLKAGAGAAARAPESAAPAVGVRRPLLIRYGPERTDAEEGSRGGSGALTG